MEPQPAQVRDTGELPSLNARLTPCPDCNHQCSTYAEHCPRCGRFFRRYDAGAVVVDRRAWATTIAGGIVLGWICVSAVTVCLIVVLVILGVGLSIPTR